MDRELFDGNKISSLALRQLLRELGFRKKKSAIVVEEDGFCRECSMSDISDALEEYCVDDEQREIILGNGKNWQKVAKGLLRDTILPMKRNVPKGESGELFMYNKEATACSINTALLVRKLDELGYRMLSSDINNKDARTCKDHNNVLTLIQPTVTRDEVLSMASNDMECTAVLNHPKIPYASFANLLNGIKFKPYKDTKDKCTMFFGNGALSVHRSDLSVSLTEMSAFDFRGRKLWGENVIDNDVDVSLLDDYKKGEFYRFCTNIVGAEGLPYLMAAMGYLVYSYKDMGAAFAIVLGEADVDSNSTANGGTGKSIIATALKHIRSHSDIDGKKYKNDSSFNLQDVNEYSDIVILDDVKQDFKYESLYNPISGYTKIEKKGMTPVQTDFSESPKFLIATNFGIVTNGDSDIRRRRIIGFTNHYNANNKPFTEFGHNLFEGWEGSLFNEWQYFYGFIVACIKEYFTNGVKNYRSEKIENRAWDNIYGEALRDFCLSNYNSFLGESNAKSNEDWKELLKGVVFARHDGTCDKVFKQSMEKYGFIHKPTTLGYTTLEGKRTTRRGYYFELEKPNALQSVLRAYGYESYSTRFMDIEEETEKPLEDLNLFSGDDSGF